MSAAERATRSKTIVRGLYPIVDESADPRRAAAMARTVAIPGVSVMQVRIKNAVSDKLAHEIASTVAAICKGMGVALIVNDRVDLAMAVGAAGVHLGSDDLPMAAARRVLPATMLIGRSTDTPEEARDVAEAGADYIAWGAVFPTSTKPDAASQEGPAALARVRSALGAKVPLVAIGGITADRVALVKAAGADAFAVIGALKIAPDPAEEARRLVAAWR